MKTGMAPMRGMLVLAGTMAMLSGCAIFGSDAKQEAVPVQDAQPETKAETKPDAPAVGIQMPGEAREKLPEPGVDPMDKPGADPLSDENLTYRVHLYWQARIKEKFDISYAIESEEMHLQAPTLIKYIQRLGKNPKEYKEVRVTKVIRDKSGERATVFSHQHFKLVTPMIQREFLSEEPEIWLQEKGAWRRQFVDYNEVFRKQMGFELPEGYDPNSRQVKPNEDGKAGEKAQDLPDAKDKDSKKK